MRRGGFKGAMRKKDRSLLQYNVHSFSDAKNSGPKARRDTYQILKSKGFEDLYDASHRRKAIRIARRLLAISRLRKGQLLFVQYPLSDRAWCCYLSMFKAAKKLCLVHDLRALREWKINRGGALQTRLPPFQRLTALLA